MSNKTEQLPDFKGVLMTRVFKSPVNKLERAEGDAEKMVIGGIVAPYNSRTELWDGFFEEYAPGCFDNALKNDDIRCLGNHDANIVFGRTKNKTLRLVSTEQGLAFENDMPDTTIARDWYTSVSRGDIDQCSISFWIKSYEFIRLDDSQRLMRITEMERVFDVGPVTFPAYQNTTAEARSMIMDIFKEQMRKEENEAGAIRGGHQLDLKQKQINIINLK